jgi:hypothetical protein
MNKDYWSNKRENVIRVIDHLTDCGYIPFITFHHIEEFLLQEDDKGSVGKRLAFLKQFPIVAHSMSYSHILNSDDIGTILDLNILETKTLIEQNIPIGKEFVSIISDNLVRYVDTAKFIEEHSQYWEELYIQCAMRNFKSRRREIASFSHITLKEYGRVKTDNLGKLNFLPPVEEREEVLGRLQNTFRHGIEKYGDRKISQSEDMLNNFLSEIVEDWKEIEQSNRETTIENILESYGSRNTSTNSMSDLFFTTLSLDRLNLVSKKLGISLDNLLNRLGNRRPPSIDLYAKITTASAKANLRAEGSSMIDKYMMGFSFYITLTEVDKRNYNFIEQIVHNFSTIGLTRDKFLRTKSYDDFMKIP